MYTHIYMIYRCADLLRRLRRLVAARRQTLDAGPIITMITMITIITSITSITIIHMYIYIYIREMYREREGEIGRELASRKEIADAGPDRHVDDVRPMSKCRIT